MFRCISNCIFLVKICLYYVYILVNTNHTVSYIGITNNIERRCHENKNKLIKGFTKKYNVDKLVYYEIFDFIDLAITREKQIKGYSRIKKVALINNFNENWNDLYINGKILEPHKTKPDSNKN